MKYILILTLVLSSVLNAAKEQLTVSIVPQKYFLQKIVKDKFDINVMVAPGASPATYEPKPSQMKALMKSKAYFYTDVPFEDAWLEKFKDVAKSTVFIDTAKGIEKIAMQKHTHHEEDEHQKHKHEHEHEEDHKHEGLDPHIWLDPVLVKIQARNMFEAISKLDAKNKEFYELNYKNFLIELDVLNTELKKRLKPYEHKAFMVFHPSWGYFAKRYDLEQIAIEIQGKEPKPSELVELIDEAKKHKVKVVFVSPQFSQKSAKTISKNIEAKVVTINPLSINWNEELLETARKIVDSYK